MAARHAGLVLGLFDRRSGRQPRGRRLISRRWRRTASLLEAGFLYLKIQWRGRCWRSSHSGGGSRCGCDLRGPKQGTARPGRRPRRPDRDDRIHPHRAFRSSFLIAARRCSASLPPMMLAGRSTTPAARRPWPMVIAGLLVGASIRFVVAKVEQRQGLRPVQSRRPCMASAETFEGNWTRRHGQRSRSASLNGRGLRVAGTSREELILARRFDGGIGDVTWDRDTAASAINPASRASTCRRRGTLPGWSRHGARFVVERAPIDWLLEQRTHRPDRDTLPSWRSTAFSK